MKDGTAEVNIPAGIKYEIDPEGLILKSE